MELAILISLFCLGVALPAMASSLVAALRSSTGFRFSIIGLGASLFLWRCWRFVIRPRLHPHDPKELPYWIPVIGK